MNRLLRVGLWIVLATLLVVLVGPFLVPVTPLEGTLPPQQLADPDSQFVSLGGIEIHYKTVGKGEPALILMHGFASSLFSWREVIPVLAQNYRVLAYDRPAFGLTVRPMTWQGENPYSADYQVKLMIGLMDRLGIQKAVLVGNSAGGAIAISAAIRYPERVQALVLVDPAVYQTGSSAWRRLFFNTPQMSHLGPLLARRIQAWGRDFGKQAWHDPSKLNDAIWAGYTKPLQAENWDRGLWNFMAADQDLNLSGQLDRLNIPVLVITGDNDRIVPTDESIRLASELPQAKLVVVPACGHAPQEECPQVFLEAVQAFLEKIKLQ
jgi:pimeloyl-ACP methyl ester carboxylesterase